MHALADTADVYQKGESERIVGRWLVKNAEKRAKLVVMTKCRGAVDPSTAGPNDIGLSRLHILQACEDSLARLQTPYIDVLQAHVWDDGTPVEEQVRAFAHLIDTGKIRYYGYSNTTGWQLQKLVDTADRLGLPRPIALQQQYSLLCRQVEWEVTPVCEREGVGFLPWSPLKGGWLSGKITRESGIPANSRIAWAEATGSGMQSHPGYSKFKDDEKVWGLIDALQATAQEASCTVAQVAIRWLLQKKAVSSVVIGAKSVKQLADNIQAAKVRLPDAAMAKLDEASALPVPYPYEMVNRLQAGRARNPPV